MTEASVVNVLRTEVKRAMRGCYWHKVADRSTVGRPDTLVAWRGLTSFFEAKLIVKTGSSVDGADVVKRITTGKGRVQVSNMLSAFHATDGRAFYAVYIKDLTRPRVEIWEPVYSPELGLTTIRLCGMHDGFTHAFVVNRLLRQHSYDWRR